MRVGIIGTGAIAFKHAQSYRNIGYELVACTNTNAAKGLAFAETFGAEFVGTAEALCSHTQVDYVDVCTPPCFRLDAVKLCAASGKHILVQKPVALDVLTAKAMIDIARIAKIQFGVVSQHRFDDSIQFLKRAIDAGRLGRILEADAYVKWYRSTDYYSRPVKGSWEGEGGGALINQAIHQIDILLFLAGPVDKVTGFWQLGALHKIESEDLVNALMCFRSGAIGVIQASTAFWPGYPERLEIHGTNGTAIIRGDRLTHWDILRDNGVAPVLAADQISSGASDPMAISLIPLERQLLDFGNACMTGRQPLSSGADGYRALELVSSIYDSCRTERTINIDPSSLGQIELD
jgi:UDP-N-acetyl-2-amino-2-deoxyglucuronate dehydrogenase